MIPTSPVFSRSIDKTRQDLPRPFVIFLLFCGLLPLFALLPIRVVGASIGTHLFLILLLLSFVKVSYKRSFLEVKSTLFAPLTVFYSVVVLQLLIHPSELKLLFYYLIILSTYFLAMRITSSPNIATVSQFTKWLKYGALISFAFGILQTIFDWQLYTPDILTDVVAAHDNAGAHRTSGGMLSPNGYGYFASLVSAISFSELSCVRNRSLSNKYFTYKILFFVLSVSQIAASKSRSALLGFVIAMIFALLTRRKKITGLFYQFMVAIVLMVSVVLVYFCFFESYSAFLVRTAGDPRWMLWAAGAQYLTSFPETLILGLGIGDGNRSHITFSDNLFIELLLTGGVPLLLAFCWLLFAPLCKKNAYVQLKQTYPQFMEMIRMWRIIFFVAAMFSSAIGFLPFTPIFFFGIFFTSRLSMTVMK